MKCKEFGGYLEDEDYVQVDADIHQAILGVVSQQKRSLNEWQKMFFTNQVKNASIMENARRYHPDTIRWAIELYCRSPAAYQHIRASDVLKLPAPSTLRTYRNCITPIPGINAMAITEIERTMKQHISLPGYITLDEMKIKENIIVRDGRLIGFVDSSLTNDCQLASHILVFYVRTIKREISLPIAWYPTHITTPTQLALRYWEVLYECERRGFQIHSIVADGLATNRRFFKLVSAESAIPLDGVFVSPNPHAPERPVYLCSDPSHLQTARNSLYSSKPSGCRYMNMNGQDILWNHVEQLYNIEKSSLALDRTRLTDAHIKLNPRSKMNVGLARGVLSWKVGKCLEAIPGAAGTSKFVLMMDRWFDIVNCSPKNPIKDVGDERLQWLKEFATKLLAWKEEVKKLKQPKRLMAMPSLEGLIFTSYNFVALCERLLNQLNYVCLHSFTQDVLEAFFGNLRQLGRVSTNPDVQQAAYGIQHIIQRRCIKKVKGGSTTHGSDNAWTVVNDNPMPKRRK